MMMSYPCMGAGSVGSKSGSSFGAMSFVFFLESNTVAPVQIISMNFLETMLVMFAAVGTAVAERPTTAADWLNHVEAQVIVVPQKEALQLLDELYDPARIEAGHAKVMAMADAGTAKLVATTVLHSKSGRPSEAQFNVTHIRYPVWFSTLQEAGPLLEKAKVDTRLPAKEFEQSDVGLTLQCDATIADDGSLVRLDVSAKHRRFLGLSRMDSAVLPSGAKAYFELPRFNGCESTGTIFLKNGGRVLFGVHLVEEPLSGIELHFLRAWITPVPAKAPRIEKERTSQMKRLALLACITASALAGDTGTNVTVEFRTVRIPAADFLHKMPKLLSQGASVAELWNSAGGDGVELIGISSASSELAKRKNRGDSFISTSEENRYPADWGVPMPPIRWVSLPSYVYRAHGVKGFEVKNVGTGVSIEASPASDGRVALRVGYRFTGKPEYRTHTAAFPGGAKLLMVQPDFKTSVFEADLQIRNGESRLIGTARAEKPGFFDLTMLRLISHNP